MFAIVSDLENEDKISEDKVCRQNDDGWQKTTPYSAVCQHSEALCLPNEGQRVAEQPYDDEVKRNRIGSVISHAILGNHTTVSCNSQ